MVAPHSPGSLVEPEAHVEWRCEQLVARREGWRLLVRETQGCRYGGTCPRATGRTAASPAAQGRVGPVAASRRDGQVGHYRGHSCGENHHHLQLSGWRLRTTG